MNSIIQSIHFFYIVYRHFLEYISKDVSKNINKKTTQLFFLKLTKQTFISLGL